MFTRANPKIRGNPYDPDDPEVFSWILGAAVGMAVIIGLFFGQGSPLTDSTSQTAQSVPAKTAHAPTLPD
jgi:hypothetical protein